MAISAVVEYAVGTVPATPAAGFFDSYVDTADKRPKSIDDGGTVRVYVDRGSTETLAAKKLDSTCTDVDATDATKVVARSQSGMTTGITLTVSYGQTTSQTLSFPNITGADTVAVLALAQTFTNKTLTNPTINAYALTGTGTIGAGCTLTTPNIGAATGTSTVLTGAISSSSPSAGIGYATGAGAAVTQLTSRATGVICNAICGQITGINTSLAAGAEAIFVVTNSSVALQDVVNICVQSGPTANTSVFSVSTVTAGSFSIRIRNLHASTADTGAPIINFAVIKAVKA